MLLGLRTVVYRTPDLDEGKRWYTMVLEVTDVGDGIRAGDVVDPFGNVFGILHFKLGEVL